MLDGTKYKKIPKQNLIDVAKDAKFVQSWFSQYKKNWKHTAELQMNGLDGI